MRWMLLPAAVAFSVSGGQPAPAPALVPVVLELFTSEGCSSCPPADDLLSRLSKEQPVAGAQIIPLGMHVTYWDRLGWKDPASLLLATERQQAYGGVFGDDRVYTPQAVIDGSDELVGSDEGGVKRAIAKAVRQPRARVELRAVLDGNALRAEATVGELPADVKESIEAWMFVTEDGLASLVKRGENSGRTLHHDAVVRVIFGGQLAAARMLGFRAELRPEWRGDRLTAVVILQGTRTRRIYGAAMTPLK